MIFNIPNCLTFLRILIIPIIVTVHFSEIKFGNWISTGLYIIAAISDGLDGYLARKWNQTSKLGAFLDPVADKLLVTSMLILIVTDPVIRQSLVFGWFFTLIVLVIIGREIMISALREWMAEMGERGNVAVSLIGKYKTGLQMTAIGMLLFKETLFGLPILQMGEMMLYAAGILTIWSMVNYLSAAYRVIIAE